MYTVTTRYELRRNPDLTFKLGYLEVGTVLEGTVDGENLHVSHVNGQLRPGYFPLKYLKSVEVSPFDWSSVVVHVTYGGETREFRAINV